MSDQMKNVALWIAFLALLAFGSFTYYLLQKIGLEERDWSRIVFLHKGVEAIALAAVGYLFGKEVHRERADKAEDRAKAAENETRQAHGEKHRHQQKLSDLIKLIETKHERKASSNSSGRALEPDVERDLPGGSSRTVEPDSDWEDLTRFIAKLTKEL